MDTEIILAWDEKSVKSNTDVELANILDEKWLSLGDSIDEIVDLLSDLKDNKWASALQTRLDLLKHVQSIHWSKASLKSLNIWVFVHPGATDKLTH